MAPGRWCRLSADTCGHVGPRRCIATGSDAIAAAAAMADVDVPALDDDLYKDRARTFAEFLDDQSGAADYRGAIRRMLGSDARRLVVSIDDLRAYNRAYADGLLNDPNAYLPPFESALLALVEQLHDPLKDEIKNKQYHIGLRGSFGDHHVTTRMLRSMHLGKMMSLEGIVTRCMYLHRTL